MHCWCSKLSPLLYDPFWTQIKITWMCFLSDIIVCMCTCACMLSCVQLFATHGLWPARLICPWNFSGKNTGVEEEPFSSPGDHPNPGIEPAFLVFPALASFITLSLRFLYHWATWETPNIIAISSVQLLSHVRLFVTPWIAARQASLSITDSQSSPRLTPIKSVMPSSHLILCRPLLLLPPIPPSIRVFSNESTLHMR